MAGVMMEPQPEPQSEDPLQWLWDGVIDFQAKIQDLRIRATRNFQLPDPSEVARHDDHCGLKNTQARMPCSCCKGALTFNEAHFVTEQLTGVRAVPNPKPRTEKFKDLFSWITSA